MTKLAGGRTINRILNRRSKDDFYPTPDCATIALLSKENFDGAIHEPACGDGKISKILIKHGHKTISSDIRGTDDIFGEKNIDFFSQTQIVDNIITNPPYSLATDFIQHGYGLISNKMALLLRLSFLEGQARYKLWQKYKPSKIYIISRRLPYYEDGAWNKSGGQFCHAWFIWDKSYDGETQLDWLMPDIKLV